MTTGLVSRHFGKVTPSNNPWRTRELEIIQGRSSSPIPKIAWPVNPKHITLELVNQLVFVFKACSRDPKSLRRHLTFANLTRILSQSQRLLATYPNILNIRSPDIHTNITIVGDTHGQFHDILQLLEKNGFPSPTNWYVFNGDLVDRGSWGLEIAVMLLSFKLLYPESVHIIRGNHETTYCTTIYGFLQECKHKYSKAIHAKFQKTFARIPLAGLILPRTNTCLFPTLQGDGHGIFIAHGGLYRTPNGELGTLQDLMNMNRFIKDPETEMFLDILWSDPQTSPGLSDNHLRGCATLYGPDKTLEFLQSHGLHLMIRSHEGPDAREKRFHMEYDMMSGYAIDQKYADSDEPLLITIFSAPDYPQGPKARGNMAAYIVLEGSSDKLIPQFKQFDKAPDRPDVFPYPSEQKDLTDFDVEY